MIQLLVDNAKEVLDSQTLPGLGGVLNLALDVQSTVEHAIADQLVAKLAEQGVTARAVVVNAPPAAGDPSPLKRTAIVGAAGVAVGALVGALVASAGKGK